MNNRFETKKGLILIKKLTKFLPLILGVGIIAVVVLVIHAMNKGKKARMKDSEKSDEKTVS